MPPEVSLLNFRQDDFIPEFADWIGATSYLAEARKADVCLFIWGVAAMSLRALGKQGPAGWQRSVMAHFRCGTLTRYWVLNECRQVSPARLHITATNY